MEGFSFPGTLPCYLRYIEYLHSCPPLDDLPFNSSVDEKIADCFLRTGNYQTAINHFNRTLSLLGESGDRIIPSLKYYMQALLYLKVATAAYYKARESTASEMSFNLQKAQKYLEISYNSIKNAKEQETKDAPQNVHDFAKQYLKYSYYQDLMGICLKMKPFETNESEQNLSLQKMVEAFKELEVLQPNAL